MAFSKSHRFDQNDAFFSLICRSLSHPARLSITRQLYLSGPCTVKTLRKDKPICNATMSQHLEILRKMQIVKCEQQFPTVVYWLNTDLPETYAAVVQLLDQAKSLEAENCKSELPEIAQSFQSFASGL